MCPTKIYSNYEQFFSIDTEASFYWAGFLAADGCILTKKVKGVEYLNGLKLSLSTKDKDHIELFCSSIDYNGPITNHITQNSKINKKWNDSHFSSVSIYSTVLYKDLSRFNIVPRKTHIYTFPKWMITHSLASHYMRGYFDGDGCIRIDPKRNKRFEIRGTIPFLNDYKSVLMTNCHVKDNLVKESCGIGRLRYNGNGVSQRIHTFLYKGATLFLKRKKIIFEEVNSNGTL